MDDLHVERMTPLPTPAQLREAYPVPEAVAARVQAQRLEVAEVLSGADPRKRLLAGTVQARPRRRCARAS